jgi:uncharacterized integral membrane protein
MASSAPADDKARQVNQPPASQAGLDQPQPTHQPHASQAGVGQALPELPRHHVVRRTRVGGIWIASGLFAGVLLLLLIFILENGHNVEISYFGAHGHLPLGAALLLAAVLGILLVVIPGTGRIVQLRITARRHRHIDAATATAPAPDGAAERPAAGTPAGADPHATVAAHRDGQELPS